MQAENPVWLALYWTPQFHHPPTGNILYSHWLQSFLLCKLSICLLALWIQKNRKHKNVSECYLYNNFLNTCRQTGEKLGPYSLLKDSTIPERGFCTTLWLQSSSKILVVTQSAPFHIYNSFGYYIFEARIICLKQFLMWFRKNNANLKNWSIESHKNKICVTAKSFGHNYCIRSCACITCCVGIICPKLPLSDAFLECVETLMWEMLWVDMYKPNKADLTKH